MGKGVNQLHTIYKNKFGNIFEGYKSDFRKNLSPYAFGGIEMFNTVTSIKPKENILNNISDLSTLMSIDKFIDKSNKIVRIVENINRLRVDSSTEQNFITSLKNGTAYAAVNAFVTSDLLVSYNLFSNQAIKDYIIGYNNSKGVATNSISNKNAVDAMGSSTSGMGGSYKPNTTPTKVTREMIERTTTYSTERSGISAGFTKISIDSNTSVSVNLSHSKIISSRYAKLIRNGGVVYNKQKKDHSKVTKHHPFLAVDKDLYMGIIKKDTGFRYIKDATFIKPEVLNVLNNAVGSGRGINNDNNAKDIINSLEKANEDGSTTTNTDNLITTTLLELSVPTSVYAISDDNTHFVNSSTRGDKIYVNFAQALSNNALPDPGKIRLYKYKKIDISNSANPASDIINHAYSNPIFYNHIVDYVYDAITSKNGIINKVFSFLNNNSEIKNVQYDVTKGETLADAIKYINTITSFIIIGELNKALYKAVDIYNNYIKNYGVEDNGELYVQMFIIHGINNGGAILDANMYTGEIASKLSKFIKDNIDKLPDDKKLKGTEALKKTLEIQSDDAATQEKAQQELADGTNPADENNPPPVNFSFEKSSDSFWDDVQNDPDDGISNADYVPATGEDYYNNPTAYMKLGNNYIELGKAMNQYIYSPKMTYGIGGMPASFLPTTDPPGWATADRAGLGLNYIEHYIKYGQFVAFRPCVAVYDMSFGEAYSDSENPNVISSIFGRVASGTLVKLVPKVDKYWEQVTRLSRIAIHLLGIEKDQFNYDVGPISVEDNKMSSGKSSTAIQPYDNRQYFGAMRAIAWGSIGESFSQIIGAKTSYVRGGTDASKVLKGTFVENEVDAGVVTFMMNGPIDESDTVSNSLENSFVASAIEKHMGGSNSPGFKDFISKTFGSGTGETTNWLSYLTGHYMVPKIWSGSGYDKTLQLSFKFSTDSGDPVSRFLNVVYPLIKLYSLSLPEATGGLLFSPWILNIFSSGAANIDFGMITNISIKKSLMNISDSGIPGEIDVTISIQDMRPFLFIEKPKWWSFSSKYNGSATIMIATLVGQNVTTISKRDNRELKKTLSKLNYSDSTGDIWPNIILAARRGFSRATHYLADVRSSLGDKIVSTGFLVSGIFGVDNFDSVANAYINNSGPGLAAGTTGNTPNLADETGQSNDVVGAVNGDPNENNVPNSGDFTGVDNNNGKPGEGTVDPNNSNNSNNTSTNNSNNSKDFDAVVEKFKNNIEFNDSTKDLFYLYLRKQDISKKIKYDPDKYNRIKEKNLISYITAISNFLDSLKNDPDFKITSFKLFKDSNVASKRVYEIRGLRKGKEVVYHIGGGSATPKEIK